MAEEYRYKRVLLKLSGEALAGDLGYGIDPKVVDSLADEIADVVHDGVQLASGVGVGNILSGVSGATEGMDRAQADSLAMRATVKNAQARQDASATWRRAVWSSWLPALATRTSPPTPPQHCARASWTSTC